MTAPKYTVHTTWADSGKGTVAHFDTLEAARALFTTRRANTDILWCDLHDEERDQLLERHTGSPVEEDGDPRYGRCPYQDTHNEYGCGLDAYGVVDRRANEGRGAFVTNAAGKLLIVPTWADAQTIADLLNGKGLLHK